MAQPFLHAGQHGLVIASFEIDYAIGRETSLSDRRREEIWTSDAPEDLALGSSRDARAEQSCRRPIDRAIPAPCDLMQGAKRQPATGESRVDVGNPKRENRFGAPASAFDLFDLRAQRFYGGFGPHASS